MTRTVDPVWKRRLPRSQKRRAMTAVPAVANTEQCPECGSDDPATRLPVKRPEVHIEGGARVCRFCNRTLTFNFMRNDGGDCDCARAVEDAACSGSWHDVEVSR